MPDFVFQFGGFLAANLDRVQQAWLAAVRADERLESTDSLSEPQLKDHLPKLLSSLVECLQSGDQFAKKNVKESAKKHGQERWFQGYALRELLLEIYWLRTVLFSEVAEFSKGHPDEKSVNVTLCAMIDRHLCDVESRSVAQFVETSETSLRRANEERMRLLRTVSHELRNMLNSMSLASSLVDGKPDQDSVSQLRKNVALNVAHMTQILEDLTLLSNILSGSTSIKAAQFSPAKLLGVLTPAFEEMARGKGLKFTSFVSVGLDSVFSDEVKIRQIIENLVCNAIKYTSVGEVHLSCQAVNNQDFSIIVQDTGSGIPEAQRELIFSEYYRIDPASPLHGLGLGLAIVSSLVDLLEGSIELNSKPNEGSIFSVILPRVHNSLNLANAPI